jgi:hypothetical protein
MLNSVIINDINLELASLNTAKQRVFDMTSSRRLLFYKRIKAIEDSLHKTLRKYQKLMPIAHLL